MSIEKDASKIGTNIQFKRKISDADISTIDLAPGEPLLIPANKELRVGTTDNKKADDSTVLTLSPSKIVVTNSVANTNITNASADNGNVYIKHVEDNGDVKSSHNIKGTEAVKVTTDGSGNISVGADFTLTTATNEAAATLKLTDVKNSDADVITLTGTNGVLVQSDASGGITIDSNYKLSKTFPQTPNNSVTLNLAGSYGSTATQSSVTFVGSDNLSITEDSGKIKLNGQYTLDETDGEIQLKDAVAEVSNIPFVTGADQGQIKVGNTDINIKDLQTGSSPTFASATIGGKTLNDNGYSGNAATATSVNITNTNNVDNSVVSFQVGSGTPYSKKVDNVEHATTASNILIGDTAYTLSLNGTPSDGQITFITN